MGEKTKKNLARDAILFTSHSVGVVTAEAGERQKATHAQENPERSVGARCHAEGATIR